MSSKSETKEYDFVIIGGGACGMAAAVEAGEHGMKTLVIEKRHATGGNAMFAEGMLGAGTHIQKQHLLDVRPDAVLKAAMNYSHQSLNARILRAFIDKTADNIRWLEGMGIEFYVDNYIPGQVMWTYHKPQGAIKEVMRVLSERAKTLGVTVMTDTEVVKILQNTNGSISGIVARNIEKEFTIDTHNVLIATGGYSGNKQMIEKYFPHDSKDLICWGLHHNGDGIRMAEDCGADNEGLGILQLSGPHVPATVKVKIDVPNERPCFISVSALGREPTGVWVNMHGERFVDEAIGLNGHESPNAVIRQPEETSFALFDSDAIAYMEKNGLVKGLCQNIRDRDIERSHLPGLAKELKFQADGWMYGELSDPDKCTGCGICVDSCPAGAIDLDTLVAEKHEVSACRYACPAHVDMRSYFYLLKQGKKKDAYDIIRESNPLPAITGRVCPHFCESECARNDVDNAVNIRQLERFVADQMLQEKQEAVPFIHNEKVAVVGSGPAGLSCAYFLARKGYPVTILEAMPQAGGLLRYGIPEYRLPKEVLDAQISSLTDLGIEIKTAVEVGKDVTLKDLEKDYSAVFFAVGLQNSRSIDIPGCSRKQVMGGLEFLRSDAVVPPKTTVVVVGGGNVAVDVAMTALRRGAGTVHMVCLETGNEIPAWKEELDEAKSEGVVLHEGWGPNAILGCDASVGKVRFIKCTGIFDDRHCFSPSYDADTTMELDADMVVLAIGQAVKENPALSSLKTRSNGMICVDPVTYQTNQEGVFAGGDIIGGRGSVIKSIAEGKEAAVSIDRFLQKEDLLAGRNPSLNKVENPPKENMPNYQRSDVSIKINTGDKLKNNFEEVRPGFDGQQASLEVRRCMTCGSKSQFHFSNDCQLCRSCESNCPSSAITMKPMYKLDRPLVKIADTWEEMAQWIGCSPDVLRATVKEWNESCEHGKDRLFVKDAQYIWPLCAPPFYGIECHVAYLATIGGIKINERTEVVDKKDEVIPGLYAGGVDTGGWETDTYNVVLSGSTMGFSISSGRIAANQVLKRLQKAAE